MSKAIKYWSMGSVQVKLDQDRGAASALVLQLAEVAAPQAVFQEVLASIGGYSQYLAKRKRRR